jgi:hypothetical protein
MTTHARARAAAPFLAVGALVLTLGADPAVPWTGVLACAAAFGSAAFLRALEASAGARTARRAEQRRTRDQLSREIGRIIDASSPARLPSSSPLNRIAVRRCEEELGLLAVRLADDDPIAPEALSLARRLLREPSSPLFAEGGGRLLPTALARIAAADR